MLVVGALNIGCFFVGSKIGQKVAKAFELLDCELVDIIMSNIDNYDGTSVGQRDVPR